MQKLVWGHLSTNLLQSGQCVCFLVSVSLYFYWNVTLLAYFTCSFGFVSLTLKDIFNPFESEIANRCFSELLLSLSLETNSSNEVTVESSDSNFTFCWRQRFVLWESPVVLIRIFSVLIKIKFFTSTTFSWYSHHGSEIRYRVRRESDWSPTELFHLWADLEDPVLDPSWSRGVSAAGVAQGTAPRRTQTVSLLLHVDASGLRDKLHASAPFNYQPH